MNLLRLLLAPERDLPSERKAERRARREQFVRDQGNAELHPHWPVGKKAALRRWEKRRRRRKMAKESRRINRGRRR